MTIKEIKDIIKDIPTGSKEKGGCPISADGTPKATEPQQADSEKRNTSPTLII